LRRYIKVPAKHVLQEVLAFSSTAIDDADPRRRHAAVAVLGRGLRSSTFQLNVSGFCGIGVTFRGCSGGV